MKTVEKNNNLLVPTELIENKIYMIRGKKVIFDFDLAKLYGVKIKYLTRQVKRNSERFPDDFIMQITKNELINLRCQIGTSSWGGRRYLPYAFTEHGIAMLSSVLRSPRAIKVNIHIMRLFTKIRQMAMNYQNFQKRIEELENKYDYQFKIVFDTIKLMLKEEEKPKRKIGFLRG